MSQSFHEKTFTAVSYHGKYFRKFHAKHRMANNIQGVDIGPACLNTTTPRAVDDQFYVLESQAHIKIVKGVSDNMASNGQTCLLKM